MRVDFGSCHSVGSCQRNYDMTWLRGPALHRDCPELVSGNQVKRTLSFFCLNFCHVCLAFHQYFTVDCVTSPRVWTFGVTWLVVGGVKGPKNVMASVLGHGYTRSSTPHKTKEAQCARLNRIWLCRPWVAHSLGRTRWEEPLVSQPTWFVGRLNFFCLLLSSIAALFLASSLSQVNRNSTGRTEAMLYLKQLLTSVTTES